MILADRPKLEGYRPQKRFRGDVPCVPDALAQRFQGSPFSGLGLQACPLRAPSLSFRDAAAWLSPKKGAPPSGGTPLASNHTDPWRAQNDFVS